jgi:hypothetical protein
VESESEVAFLLLVGKIRRLTLRDALLDAFIRGPEGGSAKLESSRLWGRFNFLDDERLGTVTGEGRGVDPWRRLVMRAQEEDKPSFGQN